MDLPYKHKNLSSSPRSSCVKHPCREWEVETDSPCELTSQLTWGTRQKNDGRQELPMLLIGPLYGVETCWGFCQPGAFSCISFYVSWFKLERLAGRSLVE